MNRTVGVLFVPLAMLLACVNLSHAQESKSPDPAAPTAETPPAPDVPGLEHAFLANRAGEYATRTRFRAAPDATPEESTGTATITAILDGRFISEDNSGTIGGAPFSGRRIMGFNNRTGRFEASWFYSNSSAMLVLVGESSDLGRTIELQGSFEGAPGQMFPIKARIRHLDAERFVVEMISNAEDGSSYVILETTYARTRK